MPARAFFVFGQKVLARLGRYWFGSNAREGIFCFWTQAFGDNDDAIPFVLMPARAFLFLDYGASRLVSHPPRVLMPARAFFVFGPVAVPTGLDWKQCVLMPARAFFVFGHFARNARKWNKGRF